MTNLARLILDASERNPRAAFGTVEDPRTIADAVRIAAGLAESLQAQGVRPGARVAMIGPTSTSYLISWLALQLLGAEAALVNPTYPNSMLESMLAELQPEVVVLVDRAWEGDRPKLRFIEISAAATSTQRDPHGLPGVDRAAHSIAGFMHTSGTTGTPKFCAQSHDYFLRLGAVMSGALQLERSDVVYAPLPMFHINPLGYGVVGALTAAAGVLGTHRFSASNFWTDVVRHAITALVMHAAPVEILKRSQDDPPQHRVRTMFYADTQFMRRFGIGRAVTAYGSTEAGGVSHVHAWELFDAERYEGSISRYGGQSRSDIEWRLDGEGTILVRERERGALFSGYVRGGVVVPATDDEGWFNTGDIGECDAQGGLRFIERRVESIRVKGEYVPIPYVEEAFARLAGVEDVAIWKRQGPFGDEVVLYTAPRLPDRAAVEAIARTLPKFMRPVLVRSIENIPRDQGAGKIQRRKLDACTPLQEIVL
jgi:crotonobetaine/carnitine-CoA ligase